MICSPSSAPLLCAPTHVHVLPQVVPQDEAVRQAHAVRLHGVALAVVEVADVGVIVVGDLGVGGGTRGQGCMLEG